MAKDEKHARHGPLFCAFLKILPVSFFVLDWNIFEKPLQQPPMHLAKFLALILALAALAGCATAPATPAATTNPAAPARAPQRFAWVTGLRPEKADYYKQLHANPWPAVNRQIKASNIQNFSIYLREIEGKLYLFAYLEYTGSDFAADMKKMAEDSETQRWWKETDPCQSPLPDAAAAGKIWADTIEVYHLP